MSGRLSVVGLGPGGDPWLTHEASTLLGEAEDIFGYGPYLARLTLSPHQRAHASDNREERARAEAALALAAAGAKVAVVSGGDPGVFAMAAAVVEAIEAGPLEWRALPLQVSPGISAMLGAAARLGAPLGHDFCAISLSDNLKPWAIIAQRLKAAAEGDFVIALYNPASKARPDAVVDAFALLRALKHADTPVALARAVGRSDERILLTRLADVDTGLIDMATLVLVGSSETRFVERPGQPTLMLTPRTYGARR
jgi:precorrin-3B C17-methyltransferase